MKRLLGYGLSIFSALALSYTVHSQEIALLDVKQSIPKVSVPYTPEEKETPKREPKTEKVEVPKPAPKPAPKEHFPYKKLTLSDESPITDSWFSEETRLRLPKVKPEPEFVRPVIQAINPVLPYQGIEPTYREIEEFNEINVVREGFPYDVTERLERRLNPFDRYLTPDTDEWWDAQDSAKHRLVKAVRRTLADRLDDWQFYREGKEGVEEFADKNLTVQIERDNKYSVKIKPEFNGVRADIEAMGKKAEGKLKHDQATITFDIGKWDSKLGYNWDDDETSLRFYRALNKRTGFGVRFSESPYDKRALFTLSHSW